MSDFDIVQKDGIYMDRKPLKIGDLTARIPVIQGGMGVGISLSHLAGSVAANGGVGILLPHRSDFASQILKNIQKKRICVPYSPSLQRQEHLQAAESSDLISWLPQKIMQIT